MQSQQAVSDEINSGLVPGAKQQHDVGGEFLVGKLAAIFLGLDQLRRQVIARAAPPQLEELLKIKLGRGVSGVGLVDLGARQRHRIEQTSPFARSLEERLAVLLGYAEHVADDRDR